ncbi:MAG: toprim domain-containing protein [Candidatus Moranbacteria bacterium]|nr:toprim domain-containing protein [Candidatus Moranbacteria bacterium]
MEWGKHDTFFGMEHLDITKPVVVVEGAFDVLRLKTLGMKNVIGTHGGISHKSDKLNRLKNLSVISGFDADEPGLKFHKALERFFGKPIRRLDWSLVGCKDPGELKTKEDLQEVLKNQNMNLKFYDKWRNKL